MRNLKSYHFFWIALGFISICSFIYVSAYPKYISDEYFRRMIHQMLFFLFSVYCTICIVFINSIKPENKLQKWNLIEVINYFIYHAFKSKK